jgi:folylpolyglutamate synthase/dihydrofolate synthase
VCTLAYEALQAAGFRTALYTSPHLVDVRERMVVAGRPIPPEAFAAWTERLLPDIERTGASFFEATTAIAFADFAARGADLAVVEVGLGGRLDSTNVLTPLVSAVTHIALEHTEYLGNTLQQIAREKAGVAKAGVPFVVGEPDDALALELEQAAERAGAAPVIRVPPSERYAAATPRWRPRCYVHGPRRSDRLRARSATGSPARGSPGGSIGVDAGCSTWHTTWTGSARCWRRWTPRRPQRRFGRWSASWVTRTGGPCSSCCWAG